MELVNTISARKHNTIIVHVHRKIMFNLPLGYGFHCVALLLDCCTILLLITLTRKIKLMKHIYAFFDLQTASTFADYIGGDCAAHKDVAPAIVSMLSTNYDIRKCDCDSVGVRSIYQLQHARLRLSL